MSTTRMVLYPLKLVTGLEKGESRTEDGAERGWMEGKGRG